MIIDKIFAVIGLILDFLFLTTVRNAEPANFHVIIPIISRMLMNKPQSMSNFMIYRSIAAKTPISQCDRLMIFEIANSKICVCVILFILKKLYDFECKAQLLVQLQFDLRRLNIHLGQLAW